MGVGSNPTSDKYFSPNNSASPSESEPLVLNVFTSTKLLIAEWRSGSVLGP